MEPLIKNQFSLDKNWLPEISPRLAALPKELRYKDEKDKEIVVSSNQISIIIFDRLCRQFFDHKEDQALDTKLLSELWGGDAKGSYRVQDKLYFVYGKMHCFREESLNLAKDKNEHHWFIHKIGFPEERFKEEFISKFTSPPFGSEKELDLSLIKAAIAKDTFGGKYPSYLHKPIADMFFFE